MRLFMSVNHDGSPRFSGRGYLPLEKNPDDARHGWGLGLGKPRVVEVEVAACAARAEGWQAVRAFHAMGWEVFDLSSGTMWGRVTSDARSCEIRKRDAEYRCTVHYADNAVRWRGTAWSLDDAMTLCDEQMDALKRATDHDDLDDTLGRQLRDAEMELD